MLQTLAKNMALTSPPNSAKHRLWIDMKRLFRQHDRATNANCPLLLLPFELQEIIKSFLSLPAAAILKHTCRSLYCSGIQTTKLYEDLERSPDELYEYLYQLEKDNFWPGLLICFTCKTLHDRTAFFTSTLPSRDRQCANGSSYLEINLHRAIRFHSFTNLIRTLQPVDPIGSKVFRLTSHGHPPPIPPSYDNVVVVDLIDLDPIDLDPCYDRRQSLTQNHSWHRTDDHSYELHSRYNFFPMQSILFPSKRLSAGAICDDLIAVGVSHLCPHMNTANGEVVRTIMMIVKQGKRSSHKGLTSVVFKPRIFRCPVCRAKCTVSLHQQFSIWTPLAVRIVVERRLGKGKSATDPLWILQLKI